MSNLNACRICGFIPKRLTPSAVGVFKVVCECGNEESFLQAPSALHGRSLAGFADGDREVTERWNRNNRVSLEPQTDMVITLADPNGRVAGSTVTINYGDRSLTFRCRRQQKTDGHFHHIWEIEP